MELLCLDLEGVLIPEIWINFAEKTGIDELRATTRDIPDYDELMRMRLKILDEHGYGLPDIQAVIDTLDPMEGAKEFVEWARENFQLIILSDTFYEFAKPLMKKLGWPTLFCHRLEVHFQAMTEQGRPAQLLHQRLGELIESVRKDDQLEVFAGPFDELLGSFHRVQGIDHCLDVGQAVAMLIQNLQAHTHEFVVVRNIPGGGTQFIDAGFFSEVDPDFRDQHPFQVQAQQFHGVSPLG